MKILKRFISAVLLFVIAFTVCFLETNIANQDFAFGEDSLTTTASVAGEVTAVKNAAWSQTEADGVRIEIEEARTKGWDNPPTILFLGSLCNVHGLTKNTIIKSLTSSAAFGNVHYELFRTDRSLNNRATYTGDISMNATEAEITEKIKDVFMEYSCHSTLYNFANVLKNVTMGYEEGKNHYDYIIMEFDGLRMGHFIDGATTSDANLQAINAAADVMKEFYAAGKVSWIIPKKKTSLDTVYPYNYSTHNYQFTTSAQKADSYMFNDRFMDNDDNDNDWSSGNDALKARDRVNVRNCLKLLAPEDLAADKTVPDEPYLNNDGTISDTFATLRSRITAEEGKGIWVYYDESVKVYNFLKEKLSTCTISVVDKVTKGLTVTGVRGEYRPLDAAGNATGDWTVITQTGGFSYTSQTETDGTKITAYFDPQKIYGESYKVDSANNVSLVISCKVDETDPTKPECIFKEANNYTAETNVGDAVITTNYGAQVVVVKKASPTVTLHVPVTYHFVNRPEGTEELLPDPVNVTRGAAYTAVDTKTITKAGYVLKGWYTDEGCTAKYADGTTITTATPLYGIWEKTLADGTITTDECIYNGNEQTPENIVVQSAAGQVLKENQDYTLTVTSGTNAGEYAIVAFGIGDYAGTTLEDTWEIKPKSIADMTALVDDTVYDATAKKPQVLLNDGLTLLKEGKDYQIVLKNGHTSETNAGVYGITVEGTGNYTDTISKEWEIGKRPAVVTADNKSKTVGEKDPKFTATIINLAEGDSIEVKFTRKEGEEAGKYSIEPTSDNTNYSMLFVSGTLTIKTKDGTYPVTGDEMRVYIMALAGVLATLFIIFGMKLFIDSLSKE